MSPSDDLRVTVDRLIDLLESKSPEFESADALYFIHFLEDHIPKVVSLFDPIAIAKLISALPLVDPSSLTDRNGKSVNRAHRENAMAVAKELGPEAAQDLYRFTTLVTKLA
jgi:hypothetical protein